MYLKQAAKEDIKTFFRMSQQKHITLTFFPTHIHHHLSYENSNFFNNKSG